MNGNKEEKEKEKKSVYDGAEIEYGEWKCMFDMLIKITIREKNGDVVVLEEIPNNNDTDPVQTFRKKRNGKIVMDKNLNDVILMSDAIRKKKRTCLDK